MNTTDNKIDQLTRNLMKDTAEQPSSSLNMRIMALIMKEKQLIRKCKMKGLPSPAAIMTGFVVYMLIIVGVFYWGFSSTGTTQPNSIIAFFPILLTIGGGVSFFFLFSQLDNWLKQKEVMEQKLKQASK